MPKYKAVIFDVDDTLLKTRQPKWSQHKFVAKKYYGITLSEDELRANWGKPFDELTEILYQGNGSLAERRANFTRHELEFPKEYEPHALEAINSLHMAGILLGLMTAMFMQGAMIDFQNLHFPLDYFVVKQGSEATNYHKPDGRVFKPALATFQSLGVPSGVVYVGETLDDYQAALGAKLEFIAVTQGLVSVGEFRTAGVKNIFSNLEQVASFILE